MARGKSIQNVIFGPKFLDTVRMEHYTLEQVKDAITSPVKVMTDPELPGRRVYIGSEVSITMRNNTALLISRND